MSDEDVRADRHALLELDALLERIASLTADGDRRRFETDDTFRWVLHRLWIAIGNEALAYARASGLDLYPEQPWARLYQLRNKLAHRRLPDIDEDEVWRMTALRPAALRRHPRTTPITATPGSTGATAETPSQGPAAAPLPQRVPVADR